MLSIRGGKRLKAYPNEAHLEHCVIYLYKKYCAAHPSCNPKCSHDFYLRPLAKFNHDGIGFSCQPLGIHKIETAVKDLCKEVGLSGKHSNHSLRAMSASHLYDAGVDEQLIQERTGHCSNAVRGYKRTSSKLQKQVMDTLCGLQNSPVPPSTCPPPAVSSSLPVNVSAPAPQVQANSVSVPVTIPSDVTSHQSGMLLRETPEGMALSEALEESNISLREAMESRVCDLSTNLLSKIRTFMKKFARKSTDKSCDPLTFNVHVHFH